MGKLKNKSSKIIKLEKKAAKIIVYSLIIYSLLGYLLYRIFALQIIDGPKLSLEAFNQSRANNLIKPKRGTIYDRTGKTLAASVQVDTVSINPSLIVVKDNEEKTKILKEKVAKGFSEIFSLNYEETLAKVYSEKSLETIASKVDSETITRLKNWMKEENIYSGINIDEDTKRYYPYNNLASSLIGFCGTDNNGLFGLEQYWDDTLAGIPGKMISAVDSSRDTIPDENSKFTAAINGSNITLSIDANIQSIAEKYLKQAVEENNAQGGGCVTIMDPTNGDILAMATYPDYNLNSPFELETNDYELFRNKPVSFSYEPGSVFKTIMAAIAVEENVEEIDTPGEFYCNARMQVSSAVIRCASSIGHGSQSLRNALENSCNPALIQLGQKIGKNTLYKYFEAFGLFEKTGIQTSSEASSSFHDINNVGPIELATSSFGQRFTITPLQMITAASAIANDGVLMKPRIVTKITNPETGAITNIEPEEVRQVISKETSEQVKDIMRTVVEDGGGRYGAVKGYTIGGKTGTSEPDPGHPENGYVASFIAIAPVENTKVVILLNIFKPTKGSYYGGQIAAPVVSDILSEILPYLGIQSDNTVTEENTIAVPDLTGKTISEARQILSSLGLNYTTNSLDDEIVNNQTPKAGTNLHPNGIVALYSNEHSEIIKTTVPDVKGMSYYQSRSTLTNSNLNIQIIGSGSVVSQTPSIGTELEAGSIIKLTLKDMSGETH